MAATLGGHMDTSVKSSPAETATPVSQEGRRRLWPSLTVFYLITMATAGGLGALQPSTGLDTELLQLNQFGPTLGVLVVLAVWRGHRRPPTAFRFRAGGRTVTFGLLTVFLVAAMFAAIAAVYALMDLGPHVNPPRDWNESVLALLIAQVIGAAAEEAGWRCLLQPSLESRFPRLGASLLVGVLWGVWHVPTLTQGAVVAASFMISAVSMSVIMGALLAAARGSNLVIAALFHTAINIGMFWMFKEGGDGASETSALAAVTLVVAVLSVLIERARARRSTGSR